MSQMISRLAQKIGSLWRTLTTPRSEAVDLARREYMTKVVSLILGVVAGGLTLLFGVGWCCQVLPFDSLLITLVMTLLFSGGWWLSDRGHWRIAGYFPPVTILAAAVYGNWIGGAGAPAMILYALAIALSATLQGARAQWIILVMSVGAYIGIGWATMAGYITQLRFPETAFANRIIIVVGAYISLAGLLWFLVAEFQRIITKARAYAEHLAAINHTLTQEIEERQQVEAALREKHALLQQLIDSTPDHIYAKDRESRFLIANQGTLDSLGIVSLNDVVGRTDFDFHPPAKAALFFQEERRVFESGQPLINREESFVECAAGSIRWVLTTKAPLRDPQGQITGLVGFNRDITDRKQAEEQVRQLNAELEARVRQRTAELQAANTELQSFAYVVSHDLKAPLRAISRLVQWLVDDYTSAFDAKGKEMADLLVGRVKRMDALIDGILEYSRIGRIRGPHDAIDLNLLLPDVIDLLNPPPTIQIEIAPNLPILIGDTIRIQQVFQNLIGNAIKFMDNPHGAITVGCVDDGAFWRFSVTDTGPGIDPKHHDKLFQIFQTLHARDEIEGSGVGLAIVKKIIELFGGKIWVESQAGQGSTFWFTIPQSAPPEK